MKKSKKIFLITLVTAMLTISGFSVTAQIIVAFAGKADSPGFSGDGGPATNAKLGGSIGGGPYDIAADRAGNVFIAERTINRVRRVNAAGIINTITGNGMSSDTGDGGPATAAIISGPFGLAVDRMGNVYLSGIVNDSSRIRKINTAGIISNFAGASVPYGGDGGPATAAGLGTPGAIAADDIGNIYFANGENYIRKIDTFGIITTIAGTGAAAYSGDGGPATAAGVHQPAGIAVDSKGNVYICELSSYRIRKIDTAGIITTIAGNGGETNTGDGGPATAASMDNPKFITLDKAGNIYFTSGARVRKINTAGIITTIAGSESGISSGNGGPATAAIFRSPEGLSLDSLGNIYIAERLAGTVRKIIPVGAGTSPGLSTGGEEVLRVWPNPGEEAFTIKLVSSINEEVRVVITNTVGQKVKEITTTTNKETAIQLTAPPGMYFINAVSGSGRWSDKIITQ